MKREFLKGLDLADDVIDKIMAQNGSDINGIKDQVASLTQENESLKGQVSDRDGEIKKLGEQAGNSQKLTDQISELQKAIEDKDKTAAANLLQVRQDNAVQNYLKDAGVRDVKAVLPFIDPELVKFDGDKNELAGLSEQIDKIKQDHDYLFESDDGGQSKSAITITKKGNADGSGGTDIPDLSKMSYGEAAKLKANQPEVYQQAMDNLS
jgi:small-conductance mechanosensitive channel